MSILTQEIQQGVVNKEPVCCDRTRKVQYPICPARTRHIPEPV